MIKIYVLYTCLLFENSSLGRQTDIYIFLLEDEE